MAIVEFDRACVDFPIYSANGRSLKSKLVQMATGGKINSDAKGRVVIRALEDLTFQFQDGDRVGIIGHNGAGKSTLLRVLSGVYKPTSGTVKISGSIGSLIDISLGIDHEATGRENIYIRGALLGLKKNQIRQQVEKIIEFSELGEFADMPVRTYSTGMHLRLAFAVSTILLPEILLMDEWLSVGDKGFIKKAEGRMSELVASTNILIIATHSRDLLLDMCNKAIWLEHGRIKMIGTPAEIAKVYFQ